MQEVPALNAAWSKYGCTKCDSYKLLVISAGCYGNDTKALFQSHLTTNKVTHIATWHQEGGKLFDAALHNGGRGLTRYLIKPDKTVKQEPTAREIDTAGGLVQHVCPVSVVPRSIDKRNSVTSALFGFSKDGFTFKASADGPYAFVVYSANGQLVQRTSQKHYSAGTHKVDLRLNKGLYLVTIQTRDRRVVEKGIVR